MDKEHVEKLLNEWQAAHADAVEAGPDAVEAWEKEKAAWKKYDKASK